MRATFLHRIFPPVPPSPVKESISRYLEKTASERVNDSFPMAGSGLLSDEWAHKPDLGSSVSAAIGGNHQQFTSGGKQIVTPATPEGSGDRVGRKYMSSRSLTAGSKFKLRQALGR